MPAWRCTQNLKTLAPIGAEKSVTDFSIGEKEKWTNKGTAMLYVAVFFTQYNSSLSSFVPNFRIISQVIAEKPLTEKNVHMYMYYIRVTEGKMNNWKKKAKYGLASLLSFTQYTLPTRRWTQNSKTLAPIGAEKYVTEISIGEKEKWTNKGTDKQYVAVFCYTIQLITIKLCIKFQNFKSSSC